MRSPTTRSFLPWKLRMRESRLSGETVSTFVAILQLFSRGRIPHLSNAYCRIFGWRLTIPVNQKSCSSLATLLPLPCLVEQSADHDDGLTNLPLHRERVVVLRGGILQEPRVRVEVEEVLARLEDREERLRVELLEVGPP